ncbi:hypothetical protein QOZ80_7AG0557810 [Eleusine coracana subsp. coracana]|nr:hypothetical protein QOZ80_7AG0557810 [Eleusine coracana subsp. coracana]
MSGTVAAFPNWVMLERFIFRRDDDAAFPDGTTSKAPADTTTITASGTTTFDASFRIAFVLADPPLRLRRRRRIRRRGVRGLLPGEWKFMGVPILLTGDHPAADDAWQLSMWQTDAVIPLNGRYLCWVDYFRGILLCDLFTDPATPAISFLRFPLHEFPSTPNRSKACSWFYRCATAVDDDTATLKFVDVARDDGFGFGPLKPGALFTVTGHTLRVSGDDNNGSMEWSKDYTVTSDELWAANPGDDRLPREILMFPQVNIDRPHVVHFLIVEFGFVWKKMWVVAIDHEDQDCEVVLSVYQWEGGPWDCGR